MSSGTRARGGVGLLRLSLLIVLLCFLVPASASASGRFVYISNGLGGSQNVSALKINPDGSLTPVSGSPFGTGATTQEGLAVTPNAQNLYVTSFGTNQVMKFNIGADGGLSGLAPFAGHTNALGVAPDPLGRWLFTWDHAAGNAIGVDTINPGGSLTNITGSPFPMPAPHVDPFAGSVAPDGSHLYVPSENNSPASAPEVITEWAVGAGGALTFLDSDPAGNPANQSNPFGSSITPDGRFFFSSNPEDGPNGTLTSYSVDPSGTLSVVPGSQAVNVAPGNHPLGEAVTPDGKYLYVYERVSSTVGAYAIGNDGSLTAVPGQPFALGGGASGGANGGAVAVTPDGKRLYTDNPGSNDSTGFDIHADGSLTSFGNFPTGGTSPTLEGIAITPNQGPSASFTAQARVAGRPTSFDATSSSDPDGTVKTYDWDFGDGHKLPNGGPVPTHIYSSPGNYTVRLTVTDNEGCSTSRIFTGKATLCNASTGATTTQPVTVGSAPPPPDVARRLRILYSKKANAFKGRLSSTRVACDKDQSVSVFRKQKGPDPRVKQPATTKISGKWKLKAKDVKGQFYATVNATTLADGTTCLAARSTIIKVG